MDSLKAVEERWLNELYEHCQNIFLNFHIPSHDASHHMRVWNYAKELVVELSKNKVELSELSIEKLIIAIFFHDTGLTITLDEHHGHESKKLCEKYFRNKTDVPHELGDILSAIEHHDDKKYTKAVGREDFTTSTLAMLSVCDDLDAFGHIGVLRYAEIYLLRGVQPNLLAKKVIVNLDSRYAHFKKQCEWIGDYYIHHTQRYQKTKGFYQKLLSGDETHKEIIDLLIEKVIKERMNFEDLVHYAKRSDNPGVVNFYSKLLL